MKIRRMVSLHSNDAMQCSASFPSQLATHFLDTSTLAKIVATDLVLAVVLPKSPSCTLDTMVGIGDEFLDL